MRHGKGIGTQNLGLQVCFLISRVRQVYPALKFSVSVCETGLGLRSCCLLFESLLIHPAAEGGFLRMVVEMTE